MRFGAFIALACAAGVSAGYYPSFNLYNSAIPGLMMPAIGLGTGGYNGNNGSICTAYPENWNEGAGCGPAVTLAVQEWIALSPKPARLDTANSYMNLDAVGAGIAGVPREDLFILSKVGPGYPLGYNDTLVQIKQILTAFNVSSVDLLLIHWPYGGTPDGSSDPACNRSDSSFSDTQCRLNTWAAMVEIFNAGQASAIGVSNYNITHLQVRVPMHTCPPTYYSVVCVQEIIDAGMPLPSVNQCPFNLYLSSIQQPLRDFCAANNILFHGYSPLGVPDWKTFPSNNTNMTGIQMFDPLVSSIAAAHGVTNAQVLLAWQYALGIPTNPRTYNTTHMADNLASFEVVLAPGEVAALSSAVQDSCAIDPGFYELWCKPTYTAPF